MKAKASWRVLIFLWVFLSIIAFSGCGPDAVNPENPTPTPSSISTPVPTSTSTPTPTLGVPNLTGVKAAVFNDAASTASDCVNATVNILSNYGCTVSTISAVSIRQGGLSGYDVILLPGGTGTGECNALQQQGCDNITQFVQNGGGYIGTCAGAFAAALGYNTATTMMELVNATAFEPFNSPGTGTVQVQVTDTTSNPIMQGHPAGSSFSAHYYNGPLFIVGNNSTISAYNELAKYTGTPSQPNTQYMNNMPGKAACVNSTFGQGRCVLFSFHPELTTVADGFTAQQDLSSMLGRAVLWVTKKLN